MQIKNQFSNAEHVPELNWKP